MQPPVPENRPVGDIPGPESNYMPPVPGLPPQVNLPDTAEPPRRPGRIREQDENTTARPETVAEARARQRAQRQRAEDEQRAAAEAAAAAAKKSRRRKQMIGAGVGVGVVGAIALLYVAIPDNDDTQPVATQTAYCTVDGDQVVSDDYCSRGTYNPVTGFIFLNGMSYRYNYGGSYNNGRVTGGSYDRPPNTAFRTSSGAAVDPAKTTSFGANGQTNAASKPAPPAAGSKSGGSRSGGSGSGTNAGSNSGSSGKNIDRGGLGTSSKGGGSKGGSGSSGS
ncbi:hypothetical protein [Tsukamurella paurometabola]|uniref:Uncharacterized protein n=1 Tax=Tsukamurella paurometabola TaxID=2061 RepID=A0A3P8MD51_TSUPA|nr:hypothetical protein [Tsukamurella paurometabola]UEA84219.1 hypothetical protein LK411_05130 [Tsukamurella paurometabola]VDR41390.1 Uncharacterised protein [Tsukamurella paurometabola]